MAETPLDLALISDFTGGVNMPTREQATANYVPVAAVMPDGSVNLSYVDPAVITPGATSGFAASIAPLLGSNNTNVVQDPDDTDHLIVLPNDNLIVVEDEFLMRDFSARWGLSGVGTPTSTTVEGDSIETAGVERMLTSAAANDTAYVSSGMFFTQFFRSMSWYVSVANNTNRRVELGLGRTPSDQQFGTTAISFVYDSGVDGNWHTLTRDASVSTNNDSGVAVAAGTMYRLRIDQVSVGTILFYINDVLVATHTTNVPGGGSNFQRFAARIETLTTAAASVEVDRFVGILRRYGTRYS